MLVMMDHYDLLPTDTIVATFALLGEEAEKEPRTWSWC
jgi:hypothetical protein